MGADFILTGSINQCTVEAGTSVAVKDMLETAGPQDTAYAPAGDMFELGAKVQVFKKGIFFPARANKLYELYSRYNSLDEIDLKTRRQIEEKYFRRSFDDIWQETKSYYLDAGRGKLEELERSPKLKMALIFRWYFVHTTRLAMNGDEQQKLDYQIHCGPALGAFNRWVKGTALESWRNRHVADIAERLLDATADRLNERFAQLTGGLA
jgi:trans-AT polyketide synthase/acyltransferase/oxidoreductase domain-containing protein